MHSSRPPLIEEQSLLYPKHTDNTMHGTASRINGRLIYIEASKLLSLDQLRDKSKNDEFVIGIGGIFLPLQLKRSSFYQNKRHVLT